MGKKKPARLSGNTVSGFATLLASLECIVLGLVVGYIALLILGAITAAQGGSAMTFGELLKTTWEKGFRAASSRPPIPWAWASVWRSSRRLPSL